MHLHDNYIINSFTVFDYYLQFLDLTVMDLKVHVYRLHDDSPVSEELDEECDVSAANHWILPSSQ